MIVMEFIKILKRILKCSDFIIIRKMNNKINIITTVDVDETLNYLDNATLLMGHKTLYTICEN